MLREIFWTFVITTFSGCCLVMLKGILKSKCKTIECCGIKIERDLEIELKDREMDNVSPLTPRATL